MKSIRPACALLIILCLSLGAQTPKKAVFEVASIKPAPPLAALIMDIQSGKRGLGAFQTTINNARVDMNYAPLNSMIIMAYRLKPHQVIGPDWLASQAFEIHATIPEGVAKDKVPEMMQALLAERFNLKTHRENKEQPVYALIVSKDGHKMKEAVVQAETPAKDSAGTPAVQDSGAKNKTLSIGTPEGQITVKQESSGLTVSGARTGQMRISMGANKALLLGISKVTMADFADMLTQLVDRPVVNRTDLRGAYEVSLEIPQEELLGLVQKIAPKMGIPLPPALLSSSSALVGAVPGAGGLAATDPSGGAIFRAVQKLGLKLDSRKASVETLVIDHIEKEPTEN